MDMRLYVASRSGNRNFALHEDNILQACHGGPDPKSDAQQYARDHVKNTSEPAWVYEVEILNVIGFREERQVVSFATTVP
jgi:hypothetical protein